MLYLELPVRLPYSRKVCSDGAAGLHPSSAMVLACSAAWNGYRPMTSRLIAALQFCGRITATIHNALNRVIAS